MTRRHDPDQAAEVMRAAGLEPLGPYPGAAKPWRCRCETCGREVTPTYSTVRAGGGCRYCGREKTSDAQRLDSDQAAEVMRAAGLEPLEPYPGAGRPWRCRCKTCGREVTPTYSTVRAGGGCRYCAGLVVDADQAVEVMRTAGLEPLEPYPGAAKPWRCRCHTCGNEVMPTYSNVRAGNGGCLYCGHERTSAAQRLDADQAVEVMRTAGLEPLEPYPGAAKPWRCRCHTCGNEVAPNFSTVRAGGGCRYCAGQGRGAALRLDPDQAVEVMRAAGLEPLEPYPGFSGPWRSRCHTCGAEVAPWYGAVRDGGGCRFCAGIVVDPDQAVEVMRTAGLEPLEPYPGAATPWRCRCLTCGHEVAPTYGTVKGRQGGCIYCAGRMVDPDQAVEVMRSAGLEPLEPYPGGKTPWRCRCDTCGREVMPAYTSVRAGGGCRYCAPYGFDYAAPASVYLIVHPEFFAVKVGITGQNNRYDRLDAHARQGWGLVARWDFDDADLAAEVERRVLAWWRDDLGAPALLTADAMPQGGWSETASRLFVDPDRTVAYIERLLAASAARRP